MDILACILMMANTEKAFSFVFVFIQVPMKKMMLLYGIIRIKYSC